MPYIVSAKSKDGEPYSFRVGIGDEQSVRDWFALHHVGSTISSLSVEEETATAGSSFADSKTWADGQKEIDVKGVREQIKAQIEAALPSSVKLVADGG